jgi:insulin receptor
MQLSWNNFRVTLADKRQSLGYVISYIEAPYKNVSYFDRRDACGGDLSYHYSWIQIFFLLDGLESTIDVAVNHDAEPEENEMNTLLLISSLTLNTPSL